MLGLVVPEQGGEEPGRAGRHGQAEAGAERPGHGRPERAGRGSAPKPPATCRPRGGLARSPRAPRWRPEGGWRLARDGRRGRSGGAGPAVLPLHAGRKRVNK